MMYVYIYIYIYVNEIEHSTWCSLSVIRDIVKSWRIWIVEHKFLEDIDDEINIWSMYKLRDYNTTEKTLDTIVSEILKARSEVK